MVNSNRRSTTARATKTPVEAQYFSVNEAEVLTGLSAWTWRRWAYSGRVASVKCGSRLLIPKGEIDRVMQQGLRPAVPEHVVA